MRRVAIVCVAFSVACASQGASSADASPDVGGRAPVDATRDVATRDARRSDGPRPHPSKDAGRDAETGPERADARADGREASTRPVDAGHDSRAHDASPDAPGTECVPASTSSFTPPAYVPAVARQNRCSTDQIAAFIAACGAQGTVASCHTWLAANVRADAGATCGNCIVAPDNNGAEWTDPTGVTSANYAGCIQITDITYGPGCAAAYDSVEGCDGVACDVSCETATAAEAWFDCANTANAGSCKSYFTSEATACAVDFADGGALETCSPSATSGDPNDDLNYIVTLICGP